jgi:hypothetical protein
MREKWDSRDHELWLALLNGGLDWVKNLSLQCAYSFVKSTKDVFNMWGTLIRNICKNSLCKLKKKIENVRRCHENFLVKTYRLQ